MDRKERKYMGADPGAKYTGLSIHTLRSYAYKGVLPSFKVGTRLLFDVDDLDALIQAGKRPALRSLTAGEIDAA